MRKWYPLLIIGTLAILIDQVAKWWVMQNMLIGETRAILPALQPYLQLTRTTNTGIAFGFGEGGSQAFLVIAVIITVALLWVYNETHPADRVQYMGLALVIGGAIGNIIDRARFNHVVDFVHIVIPGFISNVSNFADHFIVIGVAILLIDSFRSEFRQTDTETDTTDETIHVEHMNVSDERPA